MVLASQGCFIINFGRQGCDFLIFPLNGLNNLSLSLLLSLKSIFNLIKSLFKLTLDLVEVIAFILHGLDILLSLLFGITSTTFLLLKFGDHILLMCHLLLQCTDLVI